MERARSVRAHCRLAAFDFVSRRAQHDGAVVSAIVGGDAIFVCAAMDGPIGIQRRAHQFHARFATRPVRRFEKPGWRDQRRQAGSRFARIPKLLEKNVEITICCSSGKYSLRIMSHDQDVSKLRRASNQQRISTRGDRAS